MIMSDRERAQVRQLRDQMSAKILATHAQLCEELKARGHTVERGPEGDVMVVNGQRLFRENFRISASRANGTTRLTGKLYYTLSTGYNRYRFDAKTYPEPKAGFDIAKMADRLIAVVEKLKSASQARADHDAFKAKAQAVCDRVKAKAEEHAARHPGVHGLIRSIDPGQEVETRVLVTLDLPEAIAYQLLKLMEDRKLDHA